MSIDLPPIVRDCRRLLVWTEEAVRLFACHHKYTVGSLGARALSGLL